MKKIISAVILGVLISVLVVPAVALGQDDLPRGCVVTGADTGILTGLACEDGGCTDLDNLTDANKDCGMCCFLLSMKRVTDWIFYLLMIFVVVMIVIGGATYMLASGDPEKAGKGKKIIIYSVVGLIIALVARLIPAVVKMVVGMST